MTPLRAPYLKTNFAQLPSLPINKELKLYNSLHYTHKKIKNNKIKPLFKSKKTFNVSTTLKNISLRALRSL